MTSPGGWIKLHRQMLHNGWLREPVLLTFWIYCLLRANHAPGKVMLHGVQIELQPGQFVTGRDSVFRDTGLSEQQYRTSLKRLKSTGSITTTATNRYTMITVINWHTYQQKSTEANEPINEPSNEQPTSSQRAANDKQDKQDIKTLKPIASNKSSQPEQTISFDFPKGVFTNLQVYRDSWLRAYPAVDIDVEVSKAAAWLLANPKNRKKNYPRFLNLWLSRAQDRSPRQQQAPTVPDTTTCVTPAQSAGIRQVLERRSANA